MPSLPMIMWALPNKKMLARIRGAFEGVEEMKNVPALRIRQTEPHFLWKTIFS